MTRTTTWVRCVVVVVGVVCAVVAVVVVGSGGGVVVGDSFSYSLARRPAPAGKAGQVPLPGTVSS